VGYALTLANEPVGDDETDAHKYGLTVCPLTNQAPQVLLYKSIAITAFLAGRKGMVPAAAVRKMCDDAIIRQMKVDQDYCRQKVEDAVRAERERCLKIVEDWKQHMCCGVDEDIKKEILTPTNQGEKE